jgi:serine/threonine protein kinase, bacterial
MALAGGEAFAGYTVARSLGSGVTGEVYLVQDARSTDWQALKVISPELAANEEFRRRFQQDVAVATSLYHPHILEVHGHGEFEGQLWVAMDYVDATSAAQLMADRFPAVSPAGEVLSIVTAVAAALDHAHEHGLLHRDVKPANILLTNPAAGEQRILLSDFGIPARTVAYAAPELLAGVDADAATDQYALAATAFHLLTGAPPASQTEVPRLSDQRPELERLDGVFARALAKRPADRFAGCREFADAVNEQAASTGDRSPEAVLVAEFPAHAWPEREDAAEPATQVAPLVSGPKPPGVPPKPPKAATVPQAPPPIPKKKRPLRTASLIAAAVLLIAGLVGVGIFVGRKTEPGAQRSGPPATTTAGPSAAAVVPSTTTSSAPAVPVDGTYRLEVQREKQTFNYLPDPQPPNVSTWWALRSSCSGTACAAAGIQLDDDDHTQAMPAGGGRLVLTYADGQWQSEPDTSPFACVGANGIAQSETTTMVLTLRPQPQGELAGEESVTVKTNECGQRAAVIRIPTVASRSGDLPDGVAVPDPATVTNTPAPPTTTR